jgi:flagellar motility protein MotE (MotC chaperone)
MAMPPAPAGITPRLRLLPTLMFLAAMFFTVKVGMLWQSADAPSAGGPIAVAGAAAKSAGAVKPPAEAAAATPAPAAPAPEPEPAFPTPPPAIAEPAAEAAQAPAFSPAEVDVLRQLAARREQLEARVRDLDKREALLKAAESRIDAKAAALEELQAEVSRLLKAHDERQDEKVASLARLYASMKPKDAAAILQTLELEPLLLVTERIKERKLAPILAEMNPARARDLTAELVRKRKVEAAARPVPPPAEVRPAR